MYKYYLYGKRIISDLHFDRLVKAEFDEYDIRIHQNQISESIINKTKEKYYEFGDEESWFSNNTLIAVIHGGDCIDYQVKPGANMRYVQTYLLGYGISMLFLQLHQLALHCSAVKDNGGAVLIAGESGAGKTTITSRLLSSGYQLMADDITVTTNNRDISYAYPAYPYQKLCRDTAIQSGYDLCNLIHIDEGKDKYLVPYGGFFDLTSVPIKALIVLSCTDISEVVAEEITGISKLWFVKENLFLRRLLHNQIPDPQMIQECLNLAARVPIYMISRPRLGDTVSDIYNIIYKIIQK